jgi:uncharacterized membrane protein HdeD (DUF308 family)
MEMMNIFYYLGIYIFWNGIFKIIKYLVDMHWNYPCTMIHKINISLSDLLFCNVTFYGKSFEYYKHYNTNKQGASWTL